MKRWQYRIEHRPIDTARQREALSLLLNGLGKNEWEAMAVVPGPSLEFVEHDADGFIQAMGTQLAVLVFLRRPDPSEAA